MDNQFYNSFDTTCFGEGRNPDYRTPFQRDRDRLIHTFAFRRLQDKTQVFMSGDYDFYRTRLTHSIEVAQIGRSICNHLKQSDPTLGEDYYVSPALVEATCIAHDLGHPPFGHAGEDALNQLMEDYGGFEANAQTVRLLTETIYKDREEGGRKGMAPTRGLVDGILKYKTIYSDHPTGDKHFIYDRQEPVLDFAFGGEGFHDEYSPGKERNGFRSLECQIMDWADDAAYSTNDLIDGIRAGFISAEDIQEWGRSQDDLDDFEEKQIEKLIEAIEDGYSEPYLSAEIGAFVKACSLEERDCFMSEKTNRYTYSLNIDSKAERKKELYSNLAFDLLFKSPRVVQLEHKGERMLRQLFSSLTDNYIQEREERTLLPRDVHRRVTETDQQQASDKGYSSEAHWKARLLCDYVAGMTDGFASRTYKRLFDPDFGSIADLV